MRDLAIHCAIHCDRLSKRYTIGAARASYETLRNRLTEVTKRADEIGLRANSAVDNLNTVLDSAEGVIRDVDSAAADVQSALGLNTNGGPGPL